MPHFIREVCQIPPIVADILQGQSLRLAIKNARDIRAFHMVTFCRVRIKLPKGGLGSLEGLFGLFNHLVKTLWIRNGHFGQGLSV